jgi:hypothetical protein
MKNKRSVLNALKALCLFWVISCLFSCASKTDRIEQIKIFYPKAEIVDVTVKNGGGGWRFIVNDSISNRLLFIECYVNGDLKAKEFFLNNR